MPKYLVRANYTASGAAGLLREGGSGRAKAITALVDSAGGSVESFYWAMVTMTSSSSPTCPIQRRGCREPECRGQRGRKVHDVRAADRGPAGGIANRQASTGRPAPDLVDPAVRRSLERRPWR
jgi:hypothetical protein